MGSESNAEVLVDRFIRMEKTMKQLRKEKRGENHLKQHLFNLEKEKTRGISNE